MADASKSNPPLPDYFELLRAMTGGAPAAAGFAGLGSAPGFGTNPGAAFGLPTMDPEEFDKKIREFEVVLSQMGAARESAGNAFSSGDMAKYAAAFNPGAWMAQMMPSALGDIGTAGNKRSPSDRGAIPRAAKKRKP
jgi:hypothetical protein